MKIVYNAIDPEAYEMRHRKSYSEAYMYSHWKPIISKLILLACRILHKYSTEVEALDIGCGTGVYTELISKCTQKAIGLDISKNMLEYARKKRKGLNLIHGDAHLLPFRNESFHLVVSIGLMEYVQKDIVLKEIARTMKKGGLLIIVTPNKYSAYRLPIKIIAKIFRRKYVTREPSFGEMIYLFHQLGFKLVWYKMDDGLIFIPSFLDRTIGMNVYYLVEDALKLTLRRNPFSNVMLFLLQKK
jgi:ubiquinone/menaquinone biosynthesis C-methylase UbiE